MRETCFPMDGSHLYTLHSIPFVDFFHLAIGQALRPAYQGLGIPPLLWIPTSQYLQNGRLVAGIGIGAYRGSMPRAETALRVLDEGQGLLVGAFAHDQRDDQLAVCCHSRVVPQVASRITLMAAQRFGFF